MPRLQRGSVRRGPKERDLRRTSLYLDARDRLYLISLGNLLGLRPTEVLRLALRTLAHRYGLTSRKKGGPLDARPHP
jgi:hypothetical protein